MTNHPRSHGAKLLRELAKTVAGWPAWMRGTRYVSLYDNNGKLVERKVAPGVGVSEETDTV